MQDRFIESMMRGLDPSNINHQGEIVVVGLGRFGSSLAQTLMTLGYEVLAIDRDPERVQELSGELTHVVSADTTQEHALRQIGVNDATTVAVCIGTDIEASVLSTAALSDLGIPNIWAKAITEAHGKILHRVGAHHVVFPEAEMGERVAHLLTGQMQEYVVLDENFVIAEMITPMAYANQELGEAGIRAKHNVTVVVIKPHGKGFTYAQPDTKLGTQDLIVVAGRREDVENFAGLG